MKKFSLLFAFLVVCFGINTTQAFAVDTTTNNFTMLDPNNSLVGGANDVHFTWDGTKKTSVAASGQVSNATLSSPCPFFGITWNAHDVAIYGPGTYTVYSGCPIGSPGCGSGAPITFTVGAGELGGHMLFNWSGNNNIDVVNVWQANSVSAPLWTGACGSNPVGTVWDWMSKDVNGDGINGHPMVDGPFTGFNANFNMMGGTPPPVVVDTTNNNFTMLDPNNSLVGGTNDVHFTWDGTKKTSVAASGQTSNAAISSPCPFFGITWNAHDMAIYGPGTYTVYTGCPAGSPGCGSGNPVTFTVGADQLGGHMLFNWSASSNIDVACVFSPHKIASPMATDGCGSNPADKVWDWAGQCAPMVDGPFPGFNANFNLMTKGTPDPCAGKVCNDDNACTTDSCDPTTGGCVFTPKNCDDNNQCTDDFCGPTVGCVNTPNNSCNGDSNLTMLDMNNGLVGGTNDVVFSWDGTKKTSVAASGQVSNATLSSPCPFFGVTWNAHDVAIYGPGTYTVYDGCPAGSPGCGSGNAVTFTVGAGQLGGHMLFSWSASDNIDVVNIWQTGIFAPSSLWTGGCGTNAASTVWQLMSTDWNADGINGAPMTDGPFQGFSANFNLNGGAVIDLCAGKVCRDRNACTTDTCDPATGTCVFTPVSCDDGNQCTADICNPKNGNCLHRKILRCR